MPVLTNSIGSVTLFDLVGNYEPSQNEGEVITRPGVDGVGFRDFGKRGTPFELKSVSYHASFAAYKTFLASCIALAATVQTVTRNGQTLANNCIVLHVGEVKPPTAIVNAAGAAGSQVRAELRWKLVEIQ